MHEKMSLTEMATQKILAQIREGEYREAQRLPPEKEIALQIGVSRTVVRDAMAVLEREGFISRKHGLGTVINRHVIAITNRMDLEQEFCEEVRACGFEPHSRLLEVRQGPADGAICHALQLAPGSAVFSVSRLIYADRQPAIFCIDYFSADLILEPYESEEAFRQPIFDFLEKYCKIDIHLDVTEVRALAADVTVAKHLELPFATPVLYMGELGYTLLGSPVLFSREYYADGFFHHTLLRKKI